MKFNNKIQKIKTYILKSKKFNKNEIKPIKIKPN